MAQRPEGRYQMINRPEKDGSITASRDILPMPGPAVDSEGLNARQSQTRAIPRWGGNVWEIWTKDVIKENNKQANKQKKKEVTAECSRQFNSGGERFSHKYKLTQPVSIWSWQKDYSKTSARPSPFGSFIQNSQGSKEGNCPAANLPAAALLQRSLEPSGNHVSFFLSTSLLFISFSGAEARLTFALVFFIINTPSPNTTV